MNQSLIVKEFVHKNDPTKVIEVSLGYTLGGMSYFTGQNSPRGYYLHVQPVEKSGGFRSFNLFSGGKKLVESATRFSQKRLEALKETCDASLYQPVVEWACSKDHIDLSQYQ